MKAIRTIPTTLRRSALILAALLPTARFAVGAETAPAYPTARAPWRAGRDDAARDALRAEIDSRRHAPASATTAHPAAADFPGAVPTDAPRVSREVTVNPRIPDWQSTGLYAAPGDCVTVTIPAAYTNLGWRVRIGAHQDRLWNKPEWSRVPELCRSFPLDAARTEAANPFGGPIYIDTRNGDDRPPAAVRIENAVEAPYFVLGQTAPDEWRKSIRARPAPWAELATSKIILTVPSDRVRALDDPTDLLRTWDAILDACADLAVRPRERRRPERIVPDVQISAGYMHSGYPIMTHADQYDILVSRDALLRGQWGLFHELGHNHQNGAWTFGGSGEVTVNLFTLYVLETVCHQPILESRHEMRAEPRARTLKKYLAGGASFEEWKREPFLALLMYVQLIEGFGWPAFQTCFAEYRDLPQEERPQSDDDKRDQWLVRFSKTVGRNLGPFFEAWGIPVRPVARQAVETLPVWMPPDWPKPAPKPAEPANEKP